MYIYLLYHTISLDRAISDPILVPTVPASSLAVALSLVRTAVADHYAAERIRTIGILSRAGDARHGLG